MLSKLIGCLFGLCLITPPLCAWWDTAHMLTAEIARTQMSPQALEKSEEIIAYFSVDFPESSTFTTASCFPDDITSIGLSGFKVWHGVLTPYDPEHVLTEETRTAVQSLTSTNNLNMAIEQCLKTLEDGSASLWAQSFMLRFLVHAVGDVHQPLHCIQLYSTDFPYGDLAGHRFKLSGRFKNLHALWDSILGLGANRIPRPLSETDQNRIAEFAAQIMTEFPANELPELDSHWSNWSQESYELATKCAYEGIALFETPSDEYLTRGQRCALRQIALAGYRLGRLLEALYGINNEEGQEGLWR